MRFSSNSNHGHRGRGGFTLVELLIATALATILLTVAASTIATMAKGSQSLLNYTEMNTQSRHALDNFAKHLRSASDVIAATSSTLTIERMDETSAIETVSYVYDPAAETLTVTQGGTTQTVLTNIASLSFNYFTFRQDPTINPLEVKHVQLEAEIARQLLTLTNRNYIISARFMLRNRRVSN